MFRITHEAATALSTARAASGAPESFGTRFSMAEAREIGQPRLAVTFVEGPVPGDEVSEQEGMPVYVAPELSAAIPEATVDAEPVDGDTQLVLKSPTP